MEAHCTGFFARQPRDWSITHFIDFMLKKHPDWTNRQILGMWCTTLSKISRCSKDKKKTCCSSLSGVRASQLLREYRCKGQASDKCMARDYLSKKREQMPNIHIDVDVDNSVVDNRVNNSVVDNRVDNSVVDNSVDNSVDNRVDVHTDPPTDLPTGLPAGPAGQEPDDLDGSSDLTQSSGLEDAFRASYSAFDGDLKWRLPSGSTVEDILYDAYLNKDLPRSICTAICNWVVDLGSDKMKALFSESDWAAIKDQVPPLPAVNEHLARSLLRFSKVKDTTGLREVLRNTSFQPRDVPYNQAQHFEPEWAERVIHQFLILYEHAQQPLRENHLEDWYTSNIWCDVVDKLFLSLPHVFLQRKEAVCQSSVLRKNRNRTEPTSRMKSGPRLDGLLRSVDDHSHEFCAIEAAPQLRGGISATKWLHDKAKLAKVLRDMLSRLIIVTNHDGRITPRLQTVSISTAGTTMQVSRLCHGKGYVSLLVTEPPRSVPRAVGQFQELLKFLVAFAQIKGVIAESIMAFRSRSQESTSDDDDEAFLRVLLDTGTAAAGRNRIPPLPRPADSP